MGLTENSWCSRRNHSWKRGGLAALTWWKCNCKESPWILLCGMVPGCYSRPRMGISGGKVCVVSRGSGCSSSDGQCLILLLSTRWGSGDLQFQSCCGQHAPQWTQEVGQGLSSPSWPLLGCSSASKGNRQQKVHHLCPLHNILHCWCWEKEHWTRWTIGLSQ